MTPTTALISWTASSGTQPVFYITNHRVNGNTDWIPNPLGVTTSTSQLITGLTGSTTYNVRVQASNSAGVAFSGIVNFTTPAGSTVVRDTASPAEWRGAMVVVASGVVPAEFFLSTAPGIIVTRDFTVSPEWTGPRGVFRDMTSQIEISATPLTPPLQVQNVQLTLPTDNTFTVTWDDNSTGSRPTGYQVQWKRSSDPTFIDFVPTVAEPNNSFSVSRMFVAPMEHGGHVTFSRDTDVSVEWRGQLGATRDAAVPVEFGGNFRVTRDFIVPSESRGTTINVTRDAAVQPERRATFRRDTVVGVEWSLTTAPPPSPTFTEIDLGDASTLTDGAGNVWGLDQSDPNGGAAVLNGVINNDSKFCDILVYRFSTQLVWIRDQAFPANWYYFQVNPSVPPGFWVGPSGDPRLG
jgi:hypothetical protein